MAKPTKAYILKHNHPISLEYARETAASCNRLDFPCEMFEGFSGIRDVEAWNSLGLFDFYWNNTKDKQVADASNKAGLCSAGHAAIWKKITENEDEAAIILEHDALMLHKVDINIPDNALVALGYRTNDNTSYKHLKAGPPKGLKPVSSHKGSHAYAITKKTALLLIERIKQNKGPLGCIDNYYFTKKSAMDIMITDPIAAICWVRESSIWSKPTTGNHLPLLPSYIEFSK